MEQFKGTPGPWIVNPELHYYNGTLAREINFGTDGECVSECVYTDYDAHLIAAAPDLLFALQEIAAHLGRIKKYSSDDYYIEQAHAAINKALGL